MNTQGTLYLWNKGPHKGFRETMIFNIDYGKWMVISVYCMPVYDDGGWVHYVCNKKSSVCLWSSHWGLPRFSDHLDIIRVTEENFGTVMVPVVITQETKYSFRNGKIRGLKLEMMIRKGYAVLADWFRGRPLQIIPAFTDLDVRCDQN